jgi:hypothetical protein
VRLTDAQGQVTDTPSTAPSSLRPAAPDDGLRDCQTVLPPVRKRLKGVERDRGLPASLLHVRRETVAAMKEQHRPRGVEQQSGRA